MKRFDKDGDDKLRYSEFCYAFLPSDSFHASLLAKKAPLTMYPQALIPKEQIFYPETTSLFLHAWTTHLQNEIEAEKLRLFTQKKKGFSVHNAFYVVDQNKDHFIDKDDLRNFLANQSLFVPEKDICALIDRYDRSHSGKISYNEFLSELTAKSIF